VNLPSECERRAGSVNVSSCIPTQAFSRFLAVAALLLFGSLPDSTRAQVSPGEAKAIENGIGARVEALTILGGDFGFADGTFHSTGALEPGQRADVDLNVAKFGGAGEIGDPMPLGDLGIGWQPRIQGSMGYLKSSNHEEEPPETGDINEYKTSSIEFGGGARFWTSERFSFAPTLMALYGHTVDSYAVQSAFARQNLPQLERLGLINWNIDTWSLRPALNIQYVIPLDRTLIALSSDSTDFYTRGFAPSNANVRVEGNSGFLTSKIDFDVPLGIELFGHELRSGGYLSRTDLFGDLKTGLAVQHLNEIHGRIVLDFLNQFWKFQWLGLGASYVWGPNMTGWTVGADATFHF
jgi:hypothetical protein